MREEFIKWLTDKDKKNLQPNTASSRISNIGIIERWYGDLDELYERGEYGRLIQDLTYSKSDERANLPARHRIPIDGNIYNGTATYKSAANLYLEFLEGGAPRPASKRSPYRTGPCRTYRLDDLDTTAGRESATDAVSSARPLTREDCVSRMIGGEAFLDKCGDQVMRLAADPLFGALVDYIKLRSAGGGAAAVESAAREILNEVEAASRFPAMGEIAQAAASQGKPKGKAYVSACFAVMALRLED